ncbi:TPA: hypothetical protein DDW69_04880 [candidate division CPR2 bacterium]|uniref:MutT/NUDIX family protein n=1 Tax=candidate division CPR2 bacterium GW2011_GWC1_41_48 TaxID=1618344 RepID=A0A0G0W8R8_UNCC2|nr:MAG: MutT/NUDIX family protein [candidate division CPR2 bacterium GW2011_GWC2_39_35]KKR27882.1 MAG: MutT/NUDIX family protein [candidate division CPR2 bacterium GW2011_GWD2_39_7]KKS09380.1 MAG: MutT/NUDIX family protein [candidate division CPR2 bacterium GW2011_GWC1_41_48]OGB71974.1 MAG: hypothetical protein A2Y26_05075 [candidate division CPR2 bacterium GWD2_39_7]HBG82136.1 hypothetical protein [candidate division CPR2 bacterium]
MKSEKIICLDHDGNTHEVLASKLVMRPAVYGIIIRDERILLSKQWDGYDLPGGGVELGETIKEALIREVKEETGIEVKVNSLVDCKDSFFKTAISNKYLHSIHIYYLCDVSGGEITTEYFDEDEKSYLETAEWMDLGDIGKIKFYSSIDLIQVIKNAEKMQSNAF